MSGCNGRKIYLTLPPSSTQTCRGSQNPLKECDIGSICLSRIRSSLLAGSRTWRIKQWPLHRWALTHLSKALLSSDQTPEWFNFKMCLSQPSFYVSLLAKFFCNPQRPIEIWDHSHWSKNAEGDRCGTCQVIEWRHSLFWMGTFCMEGSGRRDPERKNLKGVTFLICSIAISALQLLRVSSVRSNYLWLANKPYNRILQCSCRFGYGHNYRKWNI